MDRPSNDEQLLEALKTLQPLGLKHYSWPFPSQLYNNSALCSEVIRLCGAAGLHLDVDQEREIGAVKAHVEMHNAEICLKLSPWHLRYNKEDPKQWDQSAIDELQYAHDAFKKSKEVTSQHGVYDRVTTIWFDQEILRGISIEKFSSENAQDVYHNKCLDTKNNIVFEMSKYFFPQARIVQHAHSPQSWLWNKQMQRRFTGRTRPYYYKDSHYEFNSVSIYLNTEESDRNNTMWNLEMWTDLEAKTAGKNILVPAVAIGGTRRRIVGYGAPWDWTYQYPLSSDWNLGNQIHDKTRHQGDKIGDYAPWDRVPFVLCWPKLFDSRESTRPVGMHFLAYCMGANAVQEPWLFGV